jgi:serine/threonine protein kinase
MELYDCSLTKFIQERAENRQALKTAWFSAEELTLMCTNILEGLAYIHSNNIGHRDLKVNAMKPLNN